MGFTEKINQLEDVIVKSIPEAKEIALNTLLGAFLRRIFNQGKATNGAQIGNYSTKTYVKFAEGDFKSLNKNAQKRTRQSVNRKIQYIELRKKAGRQVAYVDLQFTDRLFNSIVVAYTDGNWTLGFNNLERAQIARENEVRFKKQIFYPSEEEIEIAQEAFLDYLREQVQETFNSW